MSISRFKQLACMSLTLIATACGDGGSSGPNTMSLTDACNTQPCGGSIVGTWVFEKVCNKVDFCKDQTVPVATNQIVTFRGDGTFEFSSASSQTKTVPAACVLNYPDCTQAGCVDHHDGTCSCTSRFSPLGSQVGTYTASPSGVLTLAANVTTAAAFCVSGDQLFLQTANENYLLKR